MSSFEVQELKSGVAQTMQWQASVVPRPAPHPDHVRNRKAGAMRALSLEAQNKQSVCFAHEGFAVAGTASENNVYVWDAERGDKLLSLDHGGSLTLTNLR